MTRESVVHFSGTCEQDVGEMGLCGWVSVLGMMRSIVGWFVVEGKFGLGKPTEMTIRDLLQNELKRKGVVVVSEVSYRSLDGRRLVPDLVLKNGAQYAVETKFNTEFATTNVS